MVAAPLFQQVFLGALCLSCAPGLSRCMGRGVAPFASVVSGRSRTQPRTPSIFQIGATTTGALILILVLWQTGFTGIRVGEASNPGPTVSASDGVTTPLPMSQDRDFMDTSGARSVLRSRTPLISVPSPSPAPVANPYVSVSPPPQASSSRPTRFCSFSRPGSAARRQPGPHCSSSQPFPPSLPPPPQAAALALTDQSSCPPPFSPPRPAFLSCPLMPRSFSPLSLGAPRWL